MPIIDASPIYVRSTTVGAHDPGRAPWGADLDRVADAFSRITKVTIELSTQARRDFRNEALVRRLTSLVDSADSEGDKAAAALAAKLSAAVKRAGDAAGGSGPISVGELATYWGRAGSRPTFDVASASPGTISDLAAAAPVVQFDLANSIAHLREAISDLDPSAVAMTLMSAAREGDVAAIYAAQSCARWILDESRVDVDALRLVLRRSTRPEAFADLETATRWSNFLNSNTKTFKAAVRQSADVPTFDDPVAAKASAKFDPLPKS